MTAAASVTAGLRDVITQLYRSYEERDLEAVMNALPEDFCFEWPFTTPSPARYTGLCRDKNALVTQLTDLANNFVFNEYRATNILVDGDRAAAQIHLSLTSLKTGQTFPAQIAHFWTFRDGRPSHLVEYMDTALMTAQSA